MQDHPQQFDATQFQPSIGPSVGVQPILFQPVALPSMLTAGGVPTTIATAGFFPIYATAYPPQIMRTAEAQYLQHSSNAVGSQPSKMTSPAHTQQPGAAWHRNLTINVGASNDSAPPKHSSQLGHKSSPRISPRRSPSGRGVHHPPWWAGPGLRVSREHSPRSPRSEPQNLDVGRPRAVSPHMMSPHAYVGGASAATTPELTNPSILAKGAGHIPAMPSEAAYSVMTITPDTAQQTVERPAPPMKAMVGDVASNMASGMDHRVGAIQAPSTSTPQQPKEHGSTSDVHVALPATPSCDANSVQQSAAVAANSPEPQPSEQTESAQPEGTGRASHASDFSFPPPIASSSPPHDIVGRNQVIAGNSQVVVGHIQDTIDGSSRMTTAAEHGAFEHAKHHMDSKATRSAGTVQYNPPVQNIESGHTSPPTPAPSAHLDPQLEPVVVLPSNHVVWSPRQVHAYPPGTTWQGIASKQLMVVMPGDDGQHVAEDSYGMHQLDEEESMMPTNLSSYDHDHARWVAVQTTFAVVLCVLLHQCRRPITLPNSTAAMHHM